MIHAGFSENTEKLLADALLELTKTLPFHKISVSNVAYKANVHRNTFYYHFKDLRELVLWTIHRDFSEVPDDFSSFLLTYLTRNDNFLRFANELLGTDSFLSRMRSELRPHLRNYLAAMQTAPAGISPVHSSALSTPGERRPVNTSAESRPGSTPADTRTESEKEEMILNSIAEQLLVAYLLRDKMSVMIPLILDRIFPELIKEDLV